MIKITLLVLIFSFVSLNSARAVERAILSIKEHHKIRSKDLSLILDSGLVVSHRSLWTDKEKSLLKSLNLNRFSKAWIIEVSNFADLLMLERKIHQNGLPLNLDDYELPLQTLSADWQSLQWGLKNNGASQNLDLNPDQTFRVPGVLGEDIQKAASVKLARLKRKIRVAVLDTGIDKTHPNLKNILYRNESECQQLEAFQACLANDQKSRDQCETEFMTKENPNLDPDKNGYPLDCSGWSILGNSKNPSGIWGRPDFGDDHGHGTHVAGIIAAQLDPQFMGVSGVSANVEIIPIQVIGKNPTEPIKPLSTDIGSDRLSPVEEQLKWPKQTLGDLVARGLLYALKSKADIVNLSLGWPQSRDSKLIRGLIVEMIKRGIFVVAAAGNDSTQALLRPCAYEGVICVGSHGPDGSISHFSNYGSGVDILAPGLNILSTFPMDIRPLRFRKTWGFEYLSGTSQSAPFVTGAIAEMLAQGIPSKEIYPRLISSTRNPKQNLGLFEGVPHLPDKLVTVKSNVAAKTILAGNMDFNKAIEAKSSLVILPIVKEKTAMNWNGSDKKMKFAISIKNYWKEVPFSRIQVRARFKDSDKSFRPTVTAITGLSKSGIWQPNQKVILSIEADLYKNEEQKNRLPSDLGLEVWIMSDATLVKYFVQEFELVVPLTSQTSWPGVSKFSVKDFPQGRVEWNPIDETYDYQPNKRDYILGSLVKNDATFSLLTQNAEGVYELKGANNLNLEIPFSQLRSQYLVRTLQDDQPIYILGFLDEPDEAEANALPKVYFNIFDNEFRLIEQFKYDSNKAVMPYQIYWMSVENKKRPAWIGYGKDPSVKTNLVQLWENPHGNEDLKIRFYYLSDKNELKSATTDDGYQIVDILEPSLDQKIKGIIPVLLAKNKGSEIKPSYMYEFAQAEVVNGEVKNFKKLNGLSKNYKFRNLLETKVDKIINLDTNKEEYAGTYWSNENGNREQRVTFIHFQSQRYFDQILKPLNPLYDSALLVRASFLGEKRAGAFVLTNSEIQYHDLSTGQVVSQSLERYTFYPDDFFTSVYMPLTVFDTKNPDQKLPAIFTTESSELQRGVKIVVPIFATNEKNEKKVVELMTPAKLRIETQKNSGCRPLNTPVFLGKNGYAFDYFCGDRILRVPIKL